MVLTTLNFIADLELYETERPYFLNIVGHETLPDVLQTNLEYLPHGGIQIQDIRERGLDAFSLEKNGFKILKHQTDSNVEGGDGDIEAYCDEIVRLVIQECKAVHAICYDYRVSFLSTVKQHANQEVLNLGGKPHRFAGTTWRSLTMRKVRIPEGRLRHRRCFLFTLITLLTEDQNGFEDI